MPLFGPSKARKLELALCNAAETGNVIEVEALLNQGVNVNAVCKDKKTKRSALHLAVLHRRQGVIKLLVNWAGINLEQINAHQERAVHHVPMAAVGVSEAEAAASGTRAVPPVDMTWAMELLVEAGADVNACTSMGATPLIMAAALKQEPLFRYLVSLPQTNLTHFTVDPHTKLRNTAEMYAKEMLSADALAYIRAEIARRQPPGPPASPTPVPPPLAGAPDESKMEETTPATPASPAPPTPAADEPTTSPTAAAAPPTATATATTTTTPTPSSPPPPTSESKETPPEAAAAPVHTPEEVAAATEALVEATKRDDAPGIKTAVEAGADVPAASARALHWAAARRNLRVLKALSQVDGLDVNATLASSATPLHAAAGAHADVVASDAAINLNDPTPFRYLVDMGVNPNTPDKNGCTPLMTAAAAGLDQVVQQILNMAQVDVFVTDKQGRNAADYAARNGHTHIVRMLEAMGALPAPSLATPSSKPASADHESKDGGGTPPVVPPLASPGGGGPATPVATRPEPETPEEATARLLEECAKGTFQRIYPGADVNAANDDGMAAIHLMAQHRLDHVARVLLKAPGVDLGARTKHGSYAVTLAACAPVPLVTGQQAPYSSANSAYIMAALVRSGADPNVTDANGYTPLMIAVMNQYTNIVKFLADLPETDMMAKGPNGTAADLALDRGNEVVKRILEEARARRTRAVALAAAKKEAALKRVREREEDGGGDEEGSEAGVDKDDRCCDSMVCAIM